MSCLVSLRYVFAPALHLRPSQLRNSLESADQYAGTIWSWWQLSEKLIKWKSTGGASSAVQKDTVNFQTPQFPDLKEDRLVTLAHKLFSVIREQFKLRAFVFCSPLSLSLFLWVPCGVTPQQPDH